MLQTLLIRLLCLLCHPVGPGFPHLFSFDLWPRVARRGAEGCWGWVLIQGPGLLCFQVAVWSAQPTSLLKAQFPHLCHEGSGQMLWSASTRAGSFWGFLIFVRLSPAAADFLCDWLFPASGWLVPTKQSPFQKVWNKGEKFFGKKP